MFMGLDNRYQVDSKYQAMLAHAEEVFQKVEEYQRLGLVCDDGDFVPSVHYPPITRYPDCDPDEYLKGFQYPEDGYMDVYVHVPFCIRHCTFCHYPGLVGECTEEKEKYITYLLREIDLYRERFGIDKIKPRSILLGGGTPTYLSPELLERFLYGLNERIDLSACRQYNVDLDPNSVLGALGAKRMEIMKKHGVTRLTLGIQSLDDTVLQLMNRPHNAAKGEESVYLADRAGFDLNIEFIFGHPGETLRNWIDVIERAVKLPTTEIQLYRLKVQSYGDYQGVINQYSRGDDINEIPTFRDTMLMKQIAIDILNQNGFHEKLRRVYTKNPRIFSHYAYNQCCNLYDQVGFGMTGFSSYHDRFDINSMHFDEYYRMIDEGKLPITRGYVRSPEDQIRQAIVLPLKNRSIIKADFLKRTGVSFDDVLPQKTEKLIQHGLLRDNGKVVELTEMGGFLADEVCETYNSDEFKPVPR